MSTKQVADTAEVKREKVILIADHIHGEQKCKTGDEISVTSIEKEWLIRHKRIAAPADQSLPPARRRSNPSCL